MASLSSIAGTDAGVIRERPFQLLFLTNMLPPLGTALLSPVLNSLVEPLGATPANIGLMMSAFTAPAVAVIPITGVLADRYGRRPVILFGLLWFGLTGTAISLVSTFEAALLLRFCQGFGFAALTPVIITSIGDLYSGTKEATAQGFRFTGSGITQTVFPLTAGLLVGFAWQYPFLLYAIAFPIAAVVYVWFEEPIDPDADADDGRPLKAQLADLWTLVSHRRAWTMVVARGSANLVWFGFLTYNSIVVVDGLGGTPAQAGVLAALASTSYAVAATQAGRITAHFERRLYPLVAMNVSLGAGLAVVFLADALWLAVAGVVFMGLGFGVVLSIYRTVITSLAPPTLRGGLVSLSEGSGRAAATVTPILMGVAIAVLNPQLGFVPSVRLVGIATAAVGAGVGVACLLLMSVSPPIRIEV
ncbi:MFS transporter [Haloarcula nitratireducens]|uniref:MFS transporter n=1 Tax=Haloarcula nitratireducens TaxID=2487749 RepID=A0AAW4P5R6_9EURY|nr:MFS transporter [Halomicroarcula nitratireducens]MBX0293280.1 MFS transporter [Halomicroarcula nitratireducens]